MAAISIGEFMTENSPALMSRVAKDYEKLKEDLKDFNLTADIISYHTEPIVVNPKNLEELSKLISQRINEVLEVAGINSIGIDVDIYKELDGTPAMFAFGAWTQIKEPEHGSI